MQFQVAQCDNAKVASNGPIAKSISNFLHEEAIKSPTTLSVKISDVISMLSSVKQGIETTMNISSLTMPFALFILGCVVQNVRLVLSNLIICSSVSVLIMYPITFRVSVSNVAPSLMIAVSLAMSIDYSMNFKFIFFSYEILYLTIFFEKYIFSQYLIPENLLLMPYLLCC
eukprot:GSMAST32.ASY1.ANO1.2614.1 assembled CDS